MLSEADYINMGMKHFVESYWSIYKDGTHFTEASTYIVDTYNECIDSMSFEEWVTKGNEDGLPFVADEYDFKRLFKKVFDTPLTMSRAVHLISEIYFNGNLSWEYYECSTNYFYTTMFKDGMLDEVKNFNYQGCLMEIERLNTLLEFEIASNKDVVSSIEVINHYLNNYFEPSEYNLDNVDNFKEELNDLIGGIL